MKILKFGAIWCPGCLVMRPIFKQIEAQLPDLITENYDYDFDEDMITKWEIGKKLPVYIFVDQNDNEIIRLIGEQKKDKILNLINENQDK